ncbi:MAG: hypothetical protein ACJ8FY_21425 [Gemmataceae bacterium]
MSLATVVAITGPFIKFVGDMLADLKREESGKTDLALFDLQRTVLNERFGDYKEELQKLVAQEKGRAVQDSISRGLGNSTVLDSKRSAIDRDAANELAKATREVSRANEHIALLERQAKERAASSSKKILSWCGTFLWRSFSLLRSIASGPTRRGQSRSHRNPSQE